jgi:two-component system sensor histidine kinase GlrK
LEGLRLRLLELAQEKNRFLRHMSHELKTPLANIREGTELLLDGTVGELEQPQREDIPLLVSHFLQQIASEADQERKVYAPEPLNY